MKVVVQTLIQKVVLHNTIAQAHEFHIQNII